MLDKTFQRFLLTTTVFGLMSFASSPAKAAQFSSALLVDSISFGGAGYPAIKAYNPATGAFLGDFVSPGNGLAEPDGAVFGNDGNLYVTDLSSSTAGGQILEYNGKSGQFIKTFVPYLTPDPTQSLVKLSHPAGIITDQSGNFYITSFAHNVSAPDGPTSTISDSVMEFSPTGTFIKSFSPAPGTNASFSPLGLALGPNNNLFVSSFNKGSVLSFDLTTGAATNFVAPGANGLSGPAGLAYNTNNNTLYVADYGSGAAFGEGQQLLAYNATTGAFLGKIGSSVIGDNTKGSFPVDGPIDPFTLPGGNIGVISDNNSALAVLDATPGNTSSGAFVKYLVAPGAGGLNFPVLTAVLATNITIPEPSANLSLLGLGALGVGALIKRKLEKRES